MPLLLHLHCISFLLFLHHVFSFFIQASSLGYQVILKLRCDDELSGPEVVKRTGRDIRGDVGWECRGFDEHHVIPHICESIVSSPNTYAHSDIE